MYVSVTNKALQWLTPPNEGISVSWVLCISLSSNSSVVPMFVFPLNTKYEFKALNLDIPGVLLLYIKTQLFKMDFGPGY
jgi:hypothetical protein